MLCHRFCWLKRRVSFVFDSDSLIAQVRYCFSFPFGFQGLIGIPRIKKKNKEETSWPTERNHSFTVFIVFSKCFKCPHCECYEAFLLFLFLSSVRLHGCRRAFLRLILLSPLPPLLPSPPSTSSTPRVLCFFFERPSRGWHSAHCSRGVESVFSLPPWPHLSLSLSLHWRSFTFSSFFFLLSFGSVSTWCVLKWA